MRCSCGTSGRCADGWPAIGNGVVTVTHVDKQGNLHLVIGKASFSEQQLVENYAAALDEVVRAKPSAAKGKYLRKITFTTTMGPGIQVDPNKQRNLLEETPTA